MMARAADASTTERDVALEMAAGALLSLDEPGAALEKPRPLSASDLETEADDALGNSEDDEVVEIEDDLPDGFDIDAALDVEDPEVLDIHYSCGKMNPSGLPYAWKSKIQMHVLDLYNNQPDSFNLCTKLGRGSTVKTFHLNGYGKLPRYSMLVRDGVASVHEVEMRVYRDWFDEEEEE